MKLIITNGILYGYHHVPHDAKLVHLEIPEGVTCIAASAFGGCKEICAVTFPKSLHRIEVGAFQNCTNLTEITIPEGVTDIGISAFFGCTRLAQIHFPSTIRRVGEGAFTETPWLKGYPDDLVIIGCILYKCKSKDLTAVTIPDAVTSINAFAFTGCSRLEKIHIPKTVTSIRPTAFEHTRWEKDYPAEAIIINRILYRYKGNASAYLIPPQVHTICGYAFFGNTSLRQITFSDAVTEIGAFAFQGCKASIRFCTGDLQIVVPPTKGWQSSEEQQAIRCLLEQEHREECFSLIHKSAQKIPLAILLLRCHDSDASKIYLRKNLKRAMEYVFSHDDTATLSLFLELGMITARSLETYLQLAIEKRAMQCQILLMHRKSETGGYNMDMFRL